MQKNEVYAHVKHNTWPKTAESDETQKIGGGAPRAPEVRRRWSHDYEKSRSHGCYSELEVHCY